MNSGSNKKCVIRIAAVVFAFCVSANSALAQRKTADSTVEPPVNYRIGTGDVLKITVLGQNLLSKDNVRVANDGTIRIPMVKQNVNAACLTEAELADSVAKIYREYLLNPQVSVDVTDFKSNPVALIGAVNAPGRFDLRRPTRLLELLTFVNGPTANAGDTVQIIRKSGGNSCESGALTGEPSEVGQDVVSVRLSKTLSGELESNPFISAGDIITVAEAAAIPEAYVIGNVGRAAPIPLKERTTLTKALAMAGGTTGKANIKKIKIYRQDPKTFSKSVIVVNLKEIRAEASEDIVLKANDIVEVPGPSGAKKFLNDIFRVLVPTFGRVIPVY